MKLFDALISPILFYASEVWGIDCNGQLEKDPAELVQNKFLKWLLGVNKYCNNNACSAETNYPKQHTNDIKWNENKALWGKKNQKLIGTDRIRRTLDESKLCGHRNRKHDQATT